MSEITKENEKETIGAYITNLVFSMLFPFLALWYGPKYLLKEEYIKGLVLITIVAVEVYLVMSMQ